MKIFSLSGNVQGVGFRLGLIDAAFQHGIKVWPENVEGGTQVDVIVLQGTDEQIQKYHQAVGDIDLRIDKRGEKYKTGELKDYDGPAPDWTYEIIGFMVEQLKTGAGEYFLMRQALEKLLKRLDSM